MSYKTAAVILIPVDQIWTYRKILGGVMDPMTAFLALRGMQTLELRIQRQNESAMKIAAFLIY